MARNNTGKNSILSLIALVFLLYFIVLPIVIAAAVGYFGSMAAVITAVVDLIPFGKQFYGLSIQIINAIGGQVVGYMDFSGKFSLPYFMGELAKGLLTAIIFEALNYATTTFMGVKDPEGRWNVMKKMLISVTNALIAACLAPLPLNYLLAQMPTAGFAASAIGAGLLAAVLIVGGVAIFTLIKPLSIASALLWVLLKLVAMSFIRLAFSYVAILFILVGWQNGLYGMAASGLAGLVGIALLLAGIEMMLESVIK